MTSGWAIVGAFMAGGYLAGSIPFGWLIGKARGVDIRQLGSKNIGATNCGRVCGWPFGAAAFVLDVAKGFGPTLAAVVWLPAVIEFPTERLRWLAAVLVAAMPIVGHLFPVWLGFRGGKAVATALGVVLAHADALVAGPGGPGPVGRGDPGVAVRVGRLDRGGDGNPGRLSLCRRRQAPGPTMWPSPCSSSLVVVLVDRAPLVKLRAAPAGARRTRSGAARNATPECPMEAGDPLSGPLPCCRSSAGRYNHH